MPYKVRDQAIHNGMENWNRKVEWKIVCNGKVEWKSVCVGKVLNWKLNEKWKSDIYLHLRIPKKGLQI